MRALRLLVVCLGCEHVRRLPFRKVGCALLEDGRPCALARAIREQGRCPHPQGDRWRAFAGAGMEQAGGACGGCAGRR